jgi:hypothetical protein
LVWISRGEKPRLGGVKPPVRPPLRLTARQKRFPHNCSLDEFTAPLVAIGLRGRSPPEFTLASDLSLRLGDGDIGLVSLGEGGEVWTFVVKTRQPFFPKTRTAGSRSN